MEYTCRAKFNMATPTPTYIFAPRLSTFRVTKNMLTSRLESNSKTIPSKDDFLGQELPIFIKYITICDKIMKC